MEKSSYKKFMELLSEDDKVILNENIDLNYDDKRQKIIHELESMIYRLEEMKELTDLFDDIWDDKDQVESALYRLLSQAQSDLEEAKSVLDYPRNYV